MDTINAVILVGTLARDPQMRYVQESGIPSCTATLRCEESSASGHTFTLYVPLEAYGRAAEVFGTLSEGAVLGVQGKLCWRKRVGDSKGELVVLVGKVSVLPAMAMEGG